MLECKVLIIRAALTPEPIERVGDVMYLAIISLYAEKQKPGFRNDVV